MTVDRTEEVLAHVTVSTPRPFEAMSSINGQFLLLFFSLA